jgi:hypothetical protein
MDISVCWKLIETIFCEGRRRLGDYAAGLLGFRVETLILNFSTRWQAIIEIESMCGN